MKVTRWRLDPPAASTTLIVLPGSTAGADNDGPGGSAPVTEALPGPLAEELCGARSRNAERAGLDEEDLVPAWRRYSGPLFSRLDPIVTRSWQAGSHVLIISGAYGVVTAGELIGRYKARFTPSWWPAGLVPRCLAAYAASQQLHRVLALASRTGAEARAIRSIDWGNTEVNDAWLLSPIVRGRGASRRAPTAIGEAVNALWGAGLSNDWRSTNGVGLEAQRLT